MPKKPSKEQLEIESLQQQLKAKEEELTQRQEELNAEARRSAEEHDKIANIEEKSQDGQRELEEARLQLQQALAQAQNGEAQIWQAQEEATADLRRQADSYQQRIEEETTVASQARQAYSELQGQIAELERKHEDAAQQVQIMQSNNSQAKKFLDIALGECEFATPFAYFIAMELLSTGEKRSTDVSQVSQRPVFDNPALLFRYPDVPDEILLVSAYISIPDPTALGAPPTSRLLGEARLPVSLQVAEGANASRRIVRNVTFMRLSTSSTGKDSAQPLAVGRSTLAMQAKVLTPSEISQKDSGAWRNESGKLPAVMPSLDRSLWMARPFQHCVRALVHGIEGLPMPESGGSAVARVVLRLLHPHGGVLHESATPGTEVLASDPSFDHHFHGQVLGSTHLPLGQEITLPVLKDDSASLTVQLSLELASAAAGGSGGANTAALLDLRWPLEAMPPLHPLHLRARPSHDAGQAVSSARLALKAYPSIVVSLVREPSHDALQRLDDDSCFVAEVRVHGVPSCRPLPQLVEGSLVALCLDPAGSSGNAALLKIPVITYFYDQRQALSTCMEAYYKSPTAPSRPRYFLTPVVAPRSRTPDWSQFVVRCLVPRSQLSDISLLLFEQGPGRGLDHDAPLGGDLLGFATLDASILVADRGEPMMRSYMLDLRLLEAPGAACSIEVDVRLWPHAGSGVSDGMAAKQSHSACLPAEVPMLSALGAALQSVGSVAQHAEGTSSNAAGGAQVAAPAQGAGPAAFLQHETNEFRLNHELSVQLAKEFNMRAAALRRAGEEIVSLREQVRLLRAESAQLKARIEAEEELEDKARYMPLPEGLDMLSGMELAQKLQRALERYRAERAKTAEIGRHLEVALKEAASGKVLQRNMEELERAHLLQNRELQRLQDEAKKTDTYRQTARTQEKVIAKLEKILEGSLLEVQKATKVQADVERMKAENINLRERCARLAADAGGNMSQVGIDHLRQHIAEKESEVSRLGDMLRDLRTERERLHAEAQRQRDRADEAERRVEDAAASAQRRAMDVAAAAAAAEPQAGRGSIGLGISEGMKAAALGSGEDMRPEEHALRDQLQQELKRYAEVEASRLEWEQKCISAERRLEEAEDALRKSRASADIEISSLKVEISERDVRIGELESEISERSARIDDAAAISNSSELRRAMQFGDVDELHNAIREAQAMGIHGGQIEAAQKSLAEKRQAMDALRRAHNCQISELQQAIENAQDVGLPSHVIESARDTLNEKEKDKQQRLSALKQAVSSKNVDELKKAIVDSEALGVSAQDLENAKQILRAENENALQRSKAVENLKRAARSPQIDELRKAIEDAETAGLKIPELEEAKNKLADKNKAIVALSEAVARGSAEGMRKAIEEAYEVGAVGKELEEARQALSQKNKLVDALKKAERFGSIDELKAAIQDAERNHEISKELDDARAALNQKQKAVELLKRAERSGNNDDLQKAIDEALAVRADGRDLDEARKALSERHKQHALIGMQKAQRIGDIEDLRRAIEHCEAVGVKGKDVEEGWQVLSNKIKTMDSLKKANNSGVIEDLKKAIEDAEHMGMMGRDLDDARSALTQKSKAIILVRDALNSGNMDNLRQAVADAENAHALGRELDDARVHLTEKSKAQTRALDALKKGLQLGSLVELQAAIQEGETVGLSGNVMEDAWTALGKKSKAMDNIRTMVQFGTPEDLFKAIKDGESIGLTAGDVQEAYLTLSKMTKGRRGFGKVGQSAR